MFFFKLKLYLKSLSLSYDEIVSLYENLQRYKNDDRRSRMANGWDREWEARAYLEVAPSSAPSAPVDIFDHELT